MLSVTSSSNPVIKMIKSLYKRKQRWAKKLFLVEGIKIVEECIDNGYQLENIVYSNDLLDVQGGRDLFNKIKYNKKLINVPGKLYREISDTETPQGILAVAKIVTNYIDNSSIRDNSFLLLLDRVKDPGNMGTIIRTADAFGIEGIIITNGCVDIYNPKVIRATMGSIFRVPIYSENNTLKVIEKLKNKGMAIYSTSLNESEYIQNINFNKSCILVIGNESSGVSAEITSLADKLIKIPMMGGAESLNAAVASSITMYEAIRQRTQ